MTQFYALKRYQSGPVRWDMIVPWSLIVGLGTTEAVLAVIGLFRVLLFIKAWWGSL